MPLQARSASAHPSLLLLPFGSGRQAAQQGLEERIATFQSELAGLQTAAELQEVWKHLLGAPIDDDQVSLRVQASVLARWAQLAGADAANAVLQLSGSQNSHKLDLFSLVMDAWASSDGVAALVWYHAPEQDVLAEQGFRPSAEFYRHAFGAYFAKDPQAAVRSLGALDEFPTAAHAVKGMIETSTNPGDWKLIMESLEREPDLNFRESLLAEAYTAVNLPVQASKWAERIPDPATRVELAKKVATVWSRQDPFGAADWLYGHVRGQPDAKQTLETLLSTHSPTAAQEWVAKNRIRFGPK